MHSSARDPRGSLGMPQSVSVTLCCVSSGYSDRKIAQTGMLLWDLARPREFERWEEATLDLAGTRTQKSSNLQFDFLKKILESGPVVNKPLQCGLLYHMDCCVIC